MYRQMAGMDGDKRIAGEHLAKAEALDEALAILSPLLRPRQPVARNAEG